MFGRLLGAFSPRASDAAGGQPIMSAEGEPHGEPLAKLGLETSFAVDKSTVIYARGITRESWHSEAGEPRDLEMTVHAPQGDHPTPNAKPALLLIHGGGFDVGCKEDLDPHAERFAALGMVVFSVTYRLYHDFGQTPPNWPSPDDPTAFELSESADQPTKDWAINIANRPSERHQLELFPAVYPAGRDVKAAVRWIHAHAEEYGIDEDKLCTLGFSAGGMLSAGCALSGPEDYTSELTTDVDPTLESTHLNARSDVAAAVVIAGCGMMLRLLQARDGESRCAARAAEGKPKVLMVHGSIDDQVPLSGPHGAEWLRDECLGKGVECTFHCEAGAGHNDFDEPSHPAWSLIGQFMVDNLGMR